MTIAPPLKDLYPMPDAGTLLEKAAGEAPVLVYQPYMEAHQRQRLAAEVVPFDISFAKGQTSREYELFQKLHAHHRAIGLGREVFWGLVSSKFELKSPTSFSQFYKEAQAAQRDGFDCYAYNPMITNCAIYANVWEQGRTGHPNIDPIINHLGQQGYAVMAPQGVENFFLCNYVCGNEKFWSGYFTFCEPILQDLEDHFRRGTPLGKAYGGTADYSPSPDLTMRPFVIERFLGLYLDVARKQGLKVAHYTPTKKDFDDKLGRRLSEFFYPLYLTKIAAAKSGVKEEIAAWHNLRIPVFKSPMLAFHIDDPAEWTLARIA